MTRAGRQLALALLVALPGAAYAAGVDDAGTTAANFLTNGAGGAALGMGGATLAIGGDLSSAFWNPASLSGLNGTQLLFSHAELPDATRQEWAALGGTLGGRSWAWSLGGTFVNQGSFEGRDAFNQPTGTFNASSAALSGSFARSFGNAGGLGVTTRWVTDKLGDATGSGLGFDAGLQLRHGIFGFGVGAQNLGGRMRYGSATYPMPENLGAGISIKHPMGLTLGLDWNMPKSYYNDVRAGVEYRWHETLALRAGYRRELAVDPSTESLTGPTFGIGAGNHGLWFDYAFLPSNLGATEHRIAMTFTPGKGGLGGGIFGHRVTDEKDPEVEKALESPSVMGPPTPPAPKTPPARTPPKKK